MEGDLGTSGMCLGGPVLSISLLGISTHMSAMQKPFKGMAKGTHQVVLCAMVSFKSITSKHIHKCIVFVF